MNVALPKLLCCSASCAVAGTGDSPGRRWIWTAAALVSRVLSAQAEFTVRTLSAITVCVLILPPIVFFLVPVFFGYSYFGNLFRATSREVRRLDSTTRCKCRCSSFSAPTLYVAQLRQGRLLLPESFSLCCISPMHVPPVHTTRCAESSAAPIYGHLGETLAGLSTVRAYGDQARFIARNAAMIDCNTRTRWADAVTQRWLNMRFDQISALLVGLAVFSAVFMKVDWPYLCLLARHSLTTYPMQAELSSGGLVGVVLVQLFSSVRSFRMTLKGYVNMEAQMTYVERVL